MITISGGCCAPVSLPEAEVFFSLQVKIVSPGGCCAPFSLPATHVSFNLQVMITISGGYYTPISLPAAQVFLDLQVMITISGGYYTPISLPATQVLFNLQVIRVQRQARNKHKKRPVIQLQVSSLILSISSRSAGSQSTVFNSLNPSHLAASCSSNFNSPAATVAQKQCICK